MQIEPTPCPGRTDLARDFGECSACARLSASAPASAVPPTVYSRSLGEHVCEGRRFHAQSIVDLAQSVTPNPRGFAPVDFIRRGDAL